jgi:hypothetical protein
MKQAAAAESPLAGSQQIFDAEIKKGALKSALFYLI